ncbi:MAG TPA: QueT transporter family protein [Clostridiaceae bacterium]|nr:QueT transporter family protein [Clostridiaceae bacterium]
MLTTRFIVQAALIASIYTVLTLVFAPLSFDLIQVRVSEGLTVLPYFTPAAIPGLFAGCIISNFIAGNGLIDVIFGSLATLVAAFFSRKMPKRWLVPLPPVIINAIVVGLILNYILKVPFLAAFGFVALGQSIACYGLGYVLMLVLEKIKTRIF